MQETDDSGEYASDGMASWWHSRQQPASPKHLEKLLAPAKNTKKISCTKNSMTCKCAKHRNRRFFAKCLPLRYAPDDVVQKRKKDDAAMERWRKEAGHDIRVKPSQDD